MGSTTVRVPIIENLLTPPDQSDLSYGISIHEYTPIVINLHLYVR